MIQIDDDSIVTLTDDNGVDVDFLLLDVVEYQGEDYMVLLPMEDEDSDEEDNVLILKVERTEEGEMYSGIEDEAVIDAVFELFCAELEADEDEEESAE